MFENVNVYTRSSRKQDTFKKYIFKNLLLIKKDLLMMFQRQLNKVLFKYLTMFPNVNQW